MSHNADRDYAEGHHMNDIMFSVAMLSVLTMSALMLIGLMLVVLMLTGIILSFYPDCSYAGYHCVE